MADDLKLNIDSSDAIRNLEALRNKVVEVGGQLKHFDRQNLNKIRVEFEKLKQAPLESVRAFANTVSSELNKVNDLIYKGPSGKAKIALATQIADLTNTLNKELNTQKTAITSWREHLIAQMDYVARANKVPFSNLTSKVTYNTSAAGLPLRGDEAAQLVATGLRPNQNSARASADAIKLAMDKADQLASLEDRIAFAHMNRLREQQAASIASSQAQQAAYSKAMTARAKIDEQSATIARQSSQAQADAINRQAQLNDVANFQFMNSIRKRYMEEKALRDRNNKEYEDALEAQRKADVRSAAIARTQNEQQHREIARLARVKNQPVGTEASLIEAGKQVGIPSYKLWGNFSPYDAKMMKNDFESNFIGPIKDFDIIAKQAIPTGHGVAGMLRKIGNDGGYAHSIVRGLASGFNLLWLTWGSMGPLMVGAGLSAAFVAIVKQGAEVEQSLTKIRVLADTSAEGVAGLKNAMLDLAKQGPFGPSEIAEAMKVLALAGQDAGQVLTTIRPVLNFAVAGDTTIQKSADVLTGVATAFKYTTESYTYVADVIGKTAASTKASVESMGEAFKVASAVATQYRVTLKDTAIGLGLLANINVTGTAGGTALRNFFADITGRTPKATKALAELGITLKDVFDKAGNMQPLDTIITKLLTGLEKKTPEAQFQLLRNIFTERGEKGGVEALEALVRQSEKAGKSATTIWKDLADEINKYAGFSTIAAIEMSLTASNQIKTVVSTLKAAFVEAFDELRPAIVSTSLRLRDLFRSQEFRNDISNLAETLGGAIEFVIRNVKALTTVTLAFIGLQGALVMMGSIFRAFAAGVTVAAFAAAPWATILAGLATFALSAYGAIKVLTAGTDDLTAANKRFNASDDKRLLLEKLLEEEKRLKMINEARARGISLQVLELEIAAKTAKTTRTPEQARAYAAYEAEFARQSRPRFLQGADDNADDRRVREADKATLLRLQADINAANADAIKLAKEAEEAKNRVIKLVETALPPSTLKGGRKSGSEEFDIGDPDKNLGGKTAQRAAKELDLLHQLMVDDLAKQDALHRAGLISAGEYEAERLRITVRYRTDALAKVREFSLKLDQDLAKDLAADPKHAKAINNRYKEYQDGLTDKSTSIRSEVSKRLTQEAFEYGNSINSMTQQMDKWIIKQEEAIKAETNLGVVRSNGRTRSEDLVFLEAKSKAQGLWNEKIELTVTKLEEAISRVKALDTPDILAMPEGMPALEQAKEDVERLIVLLTKLRTLSDKYGNQVGTNARNKKIVDEYDKWQKDISDNLADSISTAILDGGAEGGKKLRKILEDVLIRKPFRIILEGAMDGFIKGLGGGDFGNIWKALFSANTGMTAPASAYTQTAEDVLALMGAKAGGGTFSPNSGYRVNESGLEMATVNGKDYLLTGSSGGIITPASRVGGTTVMYSPQISIDSRTDQAQVYALVDRAVKAGNAKLLDDLKTARVI